MSNLIEKEYFFPSTKKQIRQIISEYNISSVADAYALLKDKFKDILQELWDAEQDSAFEYRKNSTNRPIYKLTNLANPQ